MRLYLIVTLCLSNLTGLAATLQVKAGREAPVKTAASGTATVIARLAAGTRVQKVTEVSLYYSIRTDDGVTGWSYKGHFDEIDAAATPTAAVSPTPESLVARPDVLKIIVLDVEVGDATLIICPVENGRRDVILIDTGEDDNDRI